MITSVVEAPARLRKIFVDRVVELAAQAAGERRRLSIALPGGSAARAFLPALAVTPLDWSGIEWWWGDERAVPPSDPESNYSIAAGLLLDRVAIPPANVHRMPADADDLEAAALQYEAELQRVLGGRPLDLVLLGVGPDGHVCSLFPGHPALKRNERQVLAIEDSPKPPSRRLTLTLAALGGAEVHIGAFGAEKAGVVREALDVPTSSLPVALAARGASRALFLVDPPAAGGSKRP